MIKGGEYYYPPLGTIGTNSAVKPVGARALLGTVLLFHTHRGLKGRRPFTSQQPGSGA